MFGRIALKSHRPAAAPAGAQVGGVTGWRGIPTPSQTQQIGAFAGTVLTQFPVNLPGVQLNCGVNSMSAGWYTPSRSQLPSFMQSQQRGFSAGPQRGGQTYAGGLGPLTVAQMNNNVAAAQVRQSGLAAFSWARGLGGIGGRIAGSLGQ